MFTGIIQNQAKLVKKKKQGKNMRLSFRFIKKEKSILLGESIATNGVCLTVAKKTTQGFAADLLEETLQTTNLGCLKLQDRVNIERSLRHGDRFGGHFVTGHVDGRARLIKRVQHQRQVLMELQVPTALVPLLALKGSVALDGISLTTQGITGNTLKVALIPHTLQFTHLKLKKKGDELNLEVDLLARYLKHYLKFEKKTGKSLKKSVSVLKKQGF